MLKVKETSKALEIGDHAPAVPFILSSPYQCTATVRLPLQPELWTPATDQEIDGDPHLLVHASIGAPREVQEHNTHAPQRHTSPTQDDCKDQASTTRRSSASPYKPTPLLPMLATLQQRYELHCYLCMILLFLLQGSSTSASKCLLRYNHGSCTGSRGSTLLRVLAKDLAVQIKLCTTPHPAGTFRSDDFS